MLRMTISPSVFEIVRHDRLRRMRGSLTASMGFSVANFDILAMSSFRFSGGNMPSNHADPLFSMPPTDP